jgi:hypothetical protein
MEENFTDKVVRFFDTNKTAIIVGLVSFFAGAVLF